MAKSCIIVGGGVAGPVAALALSRQGIQCSIYESRDTPATIGGSINLTPNGLRLLDHLDVEAPGCRVDAIELLSLTTRRRVGELPFGPSLGPARRVPRAALHKSLLAAVDKAGIRVFYGSKLASITENEADNTVVASFVGGNSATASFILGCDGIHSAVRTAYVEPDRVPEYTGVAAAYSFVPSSEITKPIEFNSTCLVFGQRGSFLMSFDDDEKSRLYYSAVMSVKQQGSREGWRTYGADHQSTLRELKRRYSDAAWPCIPEILEKTKDLFFYPIYALSSGGIWHRGRVLLLGDAAHAMPPQGESLALAIEDAVLFSRIIAESPNKSLLEVFGSYERTRRPRINRAWTEANQRWETVKDKSWVQQKLLEWVLWAVFWCKKDEWRKNIGHNVLTQEILD